MDLRLGSFILVFYYLCQQTLVANGQNNVSIPGLGTLQGVFRSTLPDGSSSRPYLAFFGIPYADPDSYTGANRFKPSKIWKEDQELNPEGDFIADNRLIRCPQVDVLDNRTTTSLAEILRLWGKRKRDESFLNQAPYVRGEEECLVLNVNTPKLPSDPENPAELLPVQVFIHGGSYAGLWGAIFGGERFLQHDALLVTINYRLGTLGSLNLGIEGAPGNAAMYDILTSLKWVKKYIKYFGGDPEKITVSGQSAGAMLASHLLTTPLMQPGVDPELPTIRGIIGLSGNALSPLSTCTDPMTHHRRLANATGCDFETAEKIRECMATKSVAELVAGMSEYSKNERYNGGFGMESRAPSLQSPDADLKVPIFMSETPYQVLEQRKQLDIPVMMGTTRHDGGFLLEDTYLQFLVPRNHVNDSVYLRNELLPDLMKGLGLDDPSGELYHSLGKVYLGNAMHADDFELKIPGLLDIHSVFIFKASAYELVEMQARKNPKSYYFSFEHSGFWSLDGGSVAPGGVGHIDSLFYLFNAYALNMAPDLDVSNRFVRYWTNFVIHGNPNGDSKMTLAAPYNPTNHAFLKIKSLYDWTGYYCRDEWINNSLELMNIVPPAPTSNPDDEPTTTDDPVNTETTPNGTARRNTIPERLAIFGTSFLIILLKAVY